MNLRLVDAKKNVYILLKVMVLFNQFNQIMHVKGESSDWGWFPMNLKGDRYGRGLQYGLQEEVRDSVCFD